MAHLGSIAFKSRGKQSNLVQPFSCYNICRDVEKILKWMPILWKPRLQCLKNERIYEIYYKKKIQHFMKRGKMAFWKKWPNLTLEKPSSSYYFDIANPFLEQGNTGNYCFKNLGCQIRHSYPIKKTKTKKNSW